jgi:anti-sigma B factor antagonist
MALEIEQSEREGVVILRLNGRITAGPEVGALRERIAELNTAGKRNVALDLAAVDYIDSTGLGALVMCAITLSKNGGGIRLVNLNRRHLELLVMTKLTTVFETFTDLQEAVNSFFPDRKVNSFDIQEFVHRMKDEDE